MPTLSRSPIAAITALMAAAVLAPLGVLSNPAVAAPSDIPGFARVVAGIPGADRALKRAKSAVTGTAANLDTTMALRDLAARLPEYTGADRKLAKRLLARPNGGTQGNERAIGAVWPGAEAGPSPKCSLTLPICVHWTKSGADRPPAGQVDRTLAVMDYVWQQEVDVYGYRAPLTDENASIDNDGVNFDVYLSDIGDRGYYGYCAVDDSRRVRFDRAGYCVLDDDFAPAQFPGNTPLENLQVTASHEFFHAIQFGYDAFEDGWFMEGTAAWIEDEVYPNVNDNRQYLLASQLAHPDKPLDRSAGLSVYGSWAFFRTLSNRFGRDVVLRSWERADGALGGPDDYSIQAVRRAIETEGATFAGVFGDYARANIAPGRYYDEGGTYPSPSVYARRLGGNSRSTGWLTQRIDHLAIHYRAAAPNRQTRLKARVRVRVDGPARATGAEARVLVRYLDGSYASRTIALNRNGDGVVTVDFGRRQVRRVVAVLANASDQFSRCFRYETEYSCGGGTPTHDDLEYAVKFTLS